MWQLIVSGVILLVLVVLVWTFFKVSGVPVPIISDPLDDPRVEWRITEDLGSSGSTVWNWKVSVGERSKQNYDFGQLAAKNHARVAARLLLGEGVVLGKTRPCPLCGKPSRFGKETDTDECTRLLDSARAELPNLVL